MNDNETVEQVCEEMRNNWAVLYYSEGTRTKNGGYSGVPVIETENLAERILAAHKREIAAKDDARLTVVANYEAVIAAKDAEIAQLNACRDGECERIKLGAEPCKGCHWQMSADAYECLRQLVKELADALTRCIAGFENVYDEECTSYGTGDAYDNAKRVLAKAREVVK